MKENYLYHGIYFLELFDKYYNHDESLKILENILKSGYLLSRRQLCLEDKPINFSGNDYISFCDRKLRYAKPYQNIGLLEKYTSYETHINSSLSLGFDRKGLEIIDTKLVQPIVLQTRQDRVIKKYGLSEEVRYSDMPDEVQIKDRVSLGNLRCLTLPVNLMTNKHSDIIYDCGDVCRCVDEINELMSDYNYSVPIYDIGSKELLNSEEQVKKVIKKYRIR